MKLTSRQADTKDLSSSSKFSASCVLTLQSLLYRREAEKVDTREGLGPGPQGREDNANKKEMAEGPGVIFQPSSGTRDMTALPSSSFTEIQIINEI